MIDGIRLAAEEKRVLACLGIDYEQFWGKGFGELGPDDIKHGVGNDELAALDALIQGKCLSSTNNHSIESWATHVLGDILMKNVQTGSEASTVKSSMDAHYNEVSFEEKWKEAKYGKLDYDIHLEETQNCFGGDMETLVNGKVFQATANINHSSRLSQQLQENLVTIHEALDSGEDEKNYDHDPAVSVWGSIGDRSGLTHTYACAPEPKEME